MAEPTIPAATRLTVAELREWLHIEHRDDDPALRRCLDAAVGEWCALTSRESADMTEIEAIAVLQRAAGMAQYRGDDDKAPDTRFFDLVRGAHNPNQLG